MVEKDAVQLAFWDGNNERLICGFVKLQLYINDKISNDLASGMFCLAAFFQLEMDTVTILDKGTGVIVGPFQEVFCLLQHAQGWGGNSRVGNLASNLLRNFQGSHRLKQMMRVDIGLAGKLTEGSIREKV